MAGTAHRLLIPSQGSVLGRTAVLVVLGTFHLQLKHAACSKGLPTAWSVGCCPQVTWVLIYF